jgi:type VI secretion system protein ImpH
MESEERPGTPDLTRLRKLAADPMGVHVFQALRIVETSFPAAPRLGKSVRPRDDRVRLTQAPEPAFPTSTLVSFAPPVGEKPAQMVNRFFGLFGPHGPLPLHLTEYARDRARNNQDRTFGAFVNIFTHRMMSLLYRAWATGQPVVSFDRRDDDPITDQIAALSGHMGAHMRDRDAMPDLAKFYFSAHLGRGPRTVEGLLSMISGYFRTKVQIEDFVGTWLELGAGDCWKLGQKVGLGRGIGIGTRVWSRSSKFRVIIGPMPIADFRRLLPGGTSFARLNAIIRNYVGDVFDWDVNLILRKEDIPEPILGQSASLGRTCWIGHSTRDEDPDDLRLSPI